MDKNLIEKYKQEMLDMYKNKEKISENALKVENIQVTTSQTPTENNISSTGQLVALVTTLRTLYPVENAKVTVYKGDLDNMQVIATEFTDESGKTDKVTLDTPSKELSLDSSNQIRPYEIYNMKVEADGYITNIHLNIPVFSGVTSLQSSNLLLRETAGVDKGPRVFDESQKYNL